MKKETKKSTFRQRGFRQPDGTIAIVNGKDVPPQGGVLLWDQLIDQTVTVTPWDEVPAEQQAQYE